MSGQTQHLEPAHSIIERLGGHDVVAEIPGVEVNRTRVFRWTYPKHRGGTGGTIPQRHIPAMMKFARKHRIPLEIIEFFQAPPRVQRGVRQARL